ncbi:hypothetical protein SNOUR_06605 [Streptomyces noursei ATCC 11455]|nr:hypothetical protein SNOUR_06605 [Streptomyces noursei ATCC 11455]
MARLRAFLQVVRLSADRTSEGPGRGVGVRGPCADRGLTVTSAAPGAAWCGVSGCGSGPGALRADLGPAGCGSTESRCLLSAGPHPGRTCRPTQPSPWPWTWLPVVACRMARHPMAQLRSTTARRSPGRTSCGGPGRTYPPTGACCQQSLRLRGFRVVPGQCRAFPGGAGRFGRGIRRHRRPRCHSIGRSKIGRPPTTVRRQCGRSLPGVRSGRPGVPERGSVDQRSTRSSGAWTIRSPVRQTA